MARASVLGEGNVMDVEVLAERQHETVGERDTVRALLHDLREPVAAIRLLAAGVGGDVARRMHVINAHAAWLAAIVETLEADDRDRLALIDVAEIVTGACDRARATITTQLTVEVIGDPTAWSRPTSLGRALACLLDNAIRAAGPDGHVVIDVTQCDGDVVVRIADDGPGPGLIASRTGLGLTTTRAVVAACHGEFRLGPGSGGGAVAEIRLPNATRARLVR